MRSLIRFSVLALAMASCRTQPPVPALRGPDGRVITPPPKASEADEQNAAKLLAEAEATSDRTAAEAKRDQIIELYPATVVTARILYDRGRAAEERGEVMPAIDSFEKLLFFRPSYEHADEVRERYAGLLVRSERFEDAANMLRALYKGAKSNVDKERLGVALAGALERAQKLAAAVEIHVALHNLPELSAAARAQ
ncbi:MAG: hypothetical protein HYZ27_11460, partial [Deltaproteobacteria bacterium]|nr:hypothetical protein [Deltaproteobacteria bacterium]